MVLLSNTLFLLENICPCYAARSFLLFAQQHKSPLPQLQPFVRQLGKEIFQRVGCEYSAIFF